MKERFTVDIYREVYLLDGELFENWEDPADVNYQINLKANHQIYILISKNMMN